VPHLRGGLSLVCLGDERPLRYKRSFAGDGPVDRAAELVLRDRGRGEETFPFFPFGYDERQFNAPGFRIPYGSLMRGQHGQFPEYHTSADDLGFVSGERLADALDACLALCDALEADLRYRNLAPYGEPQLGRRGIYRAMGGTNLGELSTAMLWVLQLSDGGCSLLEIAARSGLPVATVARAAELLREHELLADGAGS
jgi:aminopeptidase-like protein